MRSIGTAFGLLTATSMLVFCGCGSEYSTRAGRPVFTAAWAQGFPDTHPEDTKLTDAPIGNALQSYLNFAKVSYSFAPGLTEAQLRNGSPILRQNVSFNWMKVTIAQALEALTVTYGLALQKDPGADRWIVREATALDAVKLTPVTLADKNGRVTRGDNGGPGDFNFPGIMLKDVIQSLAISSHLNVILAPSLFEMREAGKPSVAETPVTSKGNVSSMQSELQALLDDNHLEAAEIPGNPILIIRPKQK